MEVGMNNATNTAIFGKSQSEPGSKESSPFIHELKRQESYDLRKLKKESLLSPRSKAFFDEIEKKRKDINSKSSSLEIMNYYMGLLNEIPQKYHWKLFLDLAESFKKEGNYLNAKSFYKMATYIQPYNSDVISH